MASTMTQVDAKAGVPIAAQERIKARRSYSRQYKADVVAQCLQPGASVSAIALSHGINANVIRKWLPRATQASTNRGPAFLPVRLEAAAVAANPSPRKAVAPIELIVNGVIVRLSAGFDPIELRSVVQILAALR